MVLIPGLDSTKEEFFHWENAFLARGMATLSMDGPGQGEAGFRLPIRHDYEVAVAAMLDALGGRDRRRPRARRRGRRQPRRLLRAARGGVRAADPRRGRDQRPVQLRRGVGRPAAAHARGVHGQVGRARRARGPRARARARPDGVLGALEQPALFVTGGLDRIIPWRQTERAAREAPNGSSCCTSRARTCAATCPTGTARSWRTGCGISSPVLALEPLGQPLRRREDLPLVRGAGRYIDDLALAADGPRGVRAQLSRAGADHRRCPRPVERSRPARRVHRRGPRRSGAAVRGDRARGRRGGRRAASDPGRRTRSATPASRSRRWWRSPGRRRWMPRSSSRSSTSRGTRSSIRGARRRR